MGCIRTLQDALTQCSTVQGLSISNYQTPSQKDRLQEIGTIPAEDHCSCHSCCYNVETGSSTCPHCSARALKKAAAAESDRFRRSAFANCGSSHEMPSALAHTAVSSLQLLNTHIRRSIKLPCFAPDDRDKDAQPGSSLVVDHEPVPFMW